MFDGVLVEERNAVLTSHTCSLECLGYLARTLIRLLPGLHAIALHERNFAREILGVGTNDSRHVVDGGGRRTLR